MNENIKWFAAALAVVGLSVGAFLYFSPGKKAAPATQPPVVAETPATAPPVDDLTAAHPLPSTPADAALPSLEESDLPVQDALTQLLGQKSADLFLKPGELVRHMVVAIDNLPEQKVAERIRPLKPVPGDFAVGGTDEAPVLDPANYERYQPLVQMVRSTDTQRIIATYSEFYPLFQQAYESLGHPPRHFNDRLIVVIDHLLATPEVTGPIALSREVQYEFADPKLEAMSAGQKLLLRMGPENATAVKSKLRELRGALLAMPNNP